MIELVDPEVRFKTELASMNETERKDYLIRYYRQQAERFRHEGLRLERQSACLKRNSEGYQKDWMNELDKNAELKPRITALKAEVRALEVRQLNTSTNVIYWSGIARKKNRELEEASKQIATLKAELTATREAILQLASGHDVLFMETVMAYNQDLVLGECEISGDEMKPHFAEKFTIPITAES